MSRPISVLKERLLMMSPSNTTILPHLDPNDPVIQHLSVTSMLCNQTLYSSLPDNFTGLCGITLNYQIYQGASRNLLSALSHIR